MHQPGTNTWFLPDSLQPEALLSTLAEVFDSFVVHESSATVVYADSFDWRLFQQGYILHCHDRVWALCRTDNREVLVEQEGPELKRSTLSRDFPAGRLRVVLEPLLAVRCLLPMATVDLTSRQIRLLNRDEKTVVRIVIEEQRPASVASVYRLIRLFGIRGYDQELRAARKILTQGGVHLPASPLIGFEAGCGVIGRRPLDYTSKFAVELDKGSTARQAMGRIYQHLLTTINRNLPGVLDDLDSEFLHDLRVAIRRTRSGLSLIKKVMPPAVVDSFKKDFGLLGGKTGPTRDLDVYLLKRDEYLARLPAALQPGLTSFFTDLAVQRKTEQKKMGVFLRSKKSSAILDSWERYLASEDPEPAPVAGMAVEQLAGRVIFRRFKRVLVDGQALDAQTPDSEVHRLRIQCKKLRYTIEFFSSLYPVEDIQTVIRQLKKLQDILGTFNDLSVQQQMLNTFLKRSQGGTLRRTTVESAAALGGLMQSLFREQQELRDHFAEAFTQFSDPVNMALFGRLFKRKKEPS